VSEQPRPAPGTPGAAGATDTGPRLSRRRAWAFATVFVLGCLLVPALAGVVGYRYALWGMAQRGSWDSPGEARAAIQRMKAQETVAGEFKASDVPLDGVEKCYYPDPIDFGQVVWIPRDMPTPFLTYAPRPGPMPGGHINQQQFRYHRDLAKPKPADTCRIFLVGGSTAFGTCARSNETTVAGYLERLLNTDGPRYGGRRFEVVTAANANWLSPHERITVENRLLELEPDVVIALSGYNDVGCGVVGLDVHYNRSGPDFYFAMLANAMLKQEGGEGFPLRLPNDTQRVTVNQTGTRLRRNAELSHAALQMVGADYCFALQPILCVSKKARTPRETFMLERAGRQLPTENFVERYDECRAQLSGVKRPNFHFWDLTGVFDARTEDVFIDQCHFGDRGNDFIAKRLAELVAPVLTARFARGER
jgi:lysophospholipase L1-like esterase